MIEIGIHYDVPELEYHALPGLSSTGVKAMLDSPARYQHSRRHRVEKTAFDLGHAVHGMVLGTGLDLVRIDAEEWRTNAVKEEVAAIRAAGGVPLKPSQYDTATAMAEKVKAHPDAGRLFAGGRTEVSVLWDDVESGVRCRGRLDYLHEAAGVVVDLKTARSADPREFARTAANLGYDVQAAHYLDGLTQAGGTATRFLHVLVETEAPHLVSVVELDVDYLAIGRAKTRAAIDLYARCLERGEWPGYPTGITRIAPPRWHSAPDLIEEYSS
ncbi:PD-(D/E)XK nuclease-like domain-containing protein [Oerskovia enterophila]|uniref:Exodeoxyribonuclease 8 n=1 Tax=Oerskovia enterophila TaxID=43678 RepID=A0ABX2Y433_9CELL|nr:PD-(D/E)XK nuclease-like domain-containing protein [Oerskovia enterophila]OCI31073.1 exodeoxyribonuclease 8 [Oerskovia enterophila]